MFNSYRVTGRIISISKK